MSRGILIGEKHTFNDWGLILTRVEIGYPAPKTNYIDIPHGDGSIDLTEAITGDVKYNNREGTFEFDLIDNPQIRTTLLNEIGEYLHGKKFDIKLPDEPTIVYRSRLAINNVRTSYYLNKVVIDVVSDPYKYKDEETVYTVPMTGSAVTVNLENSRKRVIPKITVSESTVVVYKEYTATINAGTHQLTWLILEKGDNEVSFTSTSGTEVVVTYREGLI